MNLCVKIIDDKELNKYNDGRTISGITKTNYDDPEIIAANLFESLETFKSCCKLFLFLYRKKNCSKYIEMNNKLVPPYDIFRKCKITGFEPINKPKEELERIENKKDSSSAGESTEVSDLNRRRLREAENKEQEKQDKLESDAASKGEKFTTDKEHFNDMEPKYGIFNEIYQNIKLILGYVMVIIIIGLLISVAPSVWATTYDIIAQFLVPAIVYILTIITQLVTIVAKSFFMAAEGTVFFIIGILSTIFSILQISTGLSLDLFKNILISLAQSLGITTTLTSTGVIGVTSTVFGVLGKITYDMFEKSIYYLMDQFMNIFKVSEGSTFSLIAIFINFFSLIFKIIYDTGYAISVLFYDIIMLSVTVVSKAPGMFLGYTSKTIFDNSKKIYMNINNIDE